MNLLKKNGSCIYKRATGLVRNKNMCEQSASSSDCFSPSASESLSFDIFSLKNNEGTVFFFAATAVELDEIPCMQIQ